MAIGATFQNPVVIDHRLQSLNMINHAILLSQPEQISISWAQHIMSRHNRDAKVFGVKLHDVDVGTSTRLRIEVDHDGDLPRRWFVKTPSLAVKARMITALPRFLHKEVSFYRSLSSQLPVRLPSVLAAESRFGRGSTLVLNDLTESNLQPGSAGEALSAERAGQVIDHLAKLHAHYRRHFAQLHQQAWLHGFSYQMENHMGSMLANPLMKRGLLLAGATVAAKLHRPALNYADNRRRIRQHLTSGPHTLVHHDCHPGNLFWSGEEPGFLDWQLVRLGEGIGDVAYFLATALPPDVRRQHERKLIARYAEHLSQQGVNDADEKWLFERYRQHLSYPFEAMVITLGIGGMMDRDSNLEMIRRSAAAVDDHDSFGRLLA